MGLQTATDYGLLRRLASYIYNAVPKDNNKVCCVDKTGWQENGSVYLMPDNTIIGEATEKYAFQSASNVVHHSSRRGTHEEWKTQVASLCQGNSRLTFVVSVSFACGLLGIINAEGGGFNLFGRSSGGKTTALNMAASVMGRPKNYILRWRSTDNGLEGTAKLHNDSLLILDELGEMDSSKAGQCAYMLANGGGKIRSNTSGNARPTAEWLLMFLSSAEITLAEHMAESGKAARAGQETRFADLPADAGKGMGIFENIHGYDSPGKFADGIKQITEQCHGTAFPAFIEAVISKGSGELQNSIRLFKEAFLDKYVPNNVSGQIYRVASRFALVAAAGEFATENGITGWEKGEAEVAVAACFMAWLNNRSHTEDQEDVRIVAVFKGYFQQYGESRFFSARYNNKGVLEVVENFRTPQRVDGFKIVKKNQIEFYVFPQSFNEISKGLNQSSTIKFLAENGYTVRDSHGRNQPQKRLPNGYGQSRIYHFTSKILTD